jgi:hypothetical protein
MMAKKREGKHPGGRPTKYRVEFAQLAYNYCLLGATDKDLADFFEVTESTVNEWKVNHPKFSESIKRGKVIADAKVAKSLFKRANGFKANDVDIKIFRGKVIKTPLIKQYPPDTIAGIFWLKNRQPDKWRDKQVVKHEGLPDSTIKVEIVNPNPVDDEP